MITSSNNAKVKQVVQWQTKAKERRKDHVFLAEGVRMCEEAPNNDLIFRKLDERKVCKTCGCFGYRPQ